jgi:hypothetical protein
VIAAEIVKDLEAALSEFAQVAEGRQRLDFQVATKTSPGEVERGKRQTTEAPGQRELRVGVSNLKEPLSRWF